MEVGETRYSHPARCGWSCSGAACHAVVPVNTAAAYARFWDVNKIHVQNYDPGPLPQFFADMFGWPHQAAVVGSVYRALTPSDRHDCGILAGNYGEAGAIDYFGAAYGLTARLVVTTTTIFGGRAAIQGKS